MENPRSDKVAVVDEVRGRLDASVATVLTEYRGLTVTEMAELRRALRTVGGDYKVYKNTLVKLAIAGGRHQPLDPLLSGPTAIAFVTGEITAVAKALRDYARGNPSLVVKGGLLGEGFLSDQDLARMADLPSRDVLLAKVAGAIAAPIHQFAGLLQALPRNLAYGLSALIDQRGGPLSVSEPGPSDDLQAPEPGEAASSVDGVAGTGTDAETPDTETAVTDTETAVTDTETAVTDTETAETPDTPETGTDAETSEDHKENTDDG